MPQIPMFSPPQGSTGGGLPANARPSLAPDVRANPNMYAGVGAAGERIGQALSDVGDIGVRIKMATDAAYVTRAQTQMEAASVDFQNWTRTHPDPATWQPELDERIGQTKETIAEGAKTISPAAQLHLNTSIQGWEMSTRKHVELQGTEQNLNIAKATYDEAVGMATMNNDLKTVEDKVKEGVTIGIYHPTVGQSIIKRARLQVATNQANALIERDPFEAEKQITEKNPDGTFKVLSNLSDTARETLMFRAHKAAAETRTNTVREWSQAIADAQNDKTGQSPMPDRDQIDTEAAHQGISPKVVAKMFAPPKPQFDAKQFAADRNEMMALDLANDPQSVNHARAMEIVATQPAGPGREELKALMDKRGDPKSVLNTAAAKDGMSLIGERFSLMAKQAVKNAYVPAIGETPGHWKATTNQAVIDRAELVRAQVQTAFGDFMEKNPQAKPDEVQKFIHDSFVSADGGGAAVFGGQPINPQTGIVPRGTSTPATTERTATNAKGEKMVYRDGKWQLMH